MNRLPLTDRLAMVALRADGAGVREVARAVDVSLETVRTYLDRLELRGARLIALLLAVDRELVARGVDPDQFESLLTLYAQIVFTCAIHPEAKAEDLDSIGNVCRLCVRDGLRRHHARRRAEGRPIVPPRRGRKEKPLPGGTPEAHEAHRADAGMSKRAYAKQIGVPQATYCLKTRDLPKAAVAATMSAPEGPPGWGPSLFGKPR